MESENKRVKLVASSDIDRPSSTAPMDESLGARSGDLLFAVPKKGRLYEKVLKLLEGSGINFERINRLDLASCTNLPVTLVFLPASDVAKYVAEGKIDMGITGQDMIEEAGVKVDKILDLDFGKCRLSLLAPTSSHIKESVNLANGRIVTSFPNLTKKYFEKIAPGSKPNIRYVSGSVEVACSLGLADAVVDLVETGTTMRAAGLVIVDDIMKTQAVLIGNPNTTHPQLRDKLAVRIDGWVTANKFCYMSYNIPRSLLPEAKKVTPGKKSPTISPLESQDWCAVSVLIAKAEVNNIMDQLQAIGATDILVFNLSNCRP